MLSPNSVSVNRRFQRSVRIDADLSTPGALSGFVLNGSGQSAIATMAQLISEGKQRAFTWTGPYGGGKSSLALALCSAVCGDESTRKTARRLFSEIPCFDDAFGSGHESWLVVPVVGRRADPVEDVREALASAIAAQAGTALTKRRKIEASGKDIIERLQAEAEGRPSAGVLLVIDEMGKFLDSATADGVDIHFFQDLAELAARSDGRLVVLGVLHQAFEQYAGRLDKVAREDWAKVQGRFVDIPFVTAVDEVIDLIGRAIVKEQVHSDTLEVAESVAASIRHRRPGSAVDLGFRLNKCWPLHPVTAALIGPVSRRRFGQNERSIFGFLCSAEPGGFQEFLTSLPRSDGQSFDPPRLWDYLRINLELAILASSDGHRWAQGVEAVERAESRGNAIHIRLTKTIALIDLFRNGSGLFPEISILDACLNDASLESIESALSDLEAWSVIIFRKHLDAWAIYAGSDFDIGTAMETTIAEMDGYLDLKRLAELAGLQPLLAKEHYHRTGTLRWFGVSVNSLAEVRDVVTSFFPKNGETGRFVLAIPQANQTERNARAVCKRVSLEAGLYPVALGLPRNAWLVRQLGTELLALEKIRSTRPELEGDAVARREIDAQVATTSAQLEEELRSSFLSATWFVRGEARASDGSRGLAKLVSRIADETFPETPVIQSEVVSRECPSSNSQAAVRQLLYAMSNAAEADNVGIEGCSAERGLYSTVLNATGLHKFKNDGHQFSEPESESGIGKSLRPMWKAAQELLTNSREPVLLSKVYELWRQPPYGVRSGVLPILSMAFMLAHSDEVAIYVEGIFQTELNELLVDRLLQGERFISLRHVAETADTRRALKTISHVVGKHGDMEVVPEPLALARALVAFAFRLPQWVRRTNAVSKPAQALRRVLFNASDPHRVLFVDLPQALGKEELPDAIEALSAAMEELSQAYPNMLESIRDRMFSVLQQGSAELSRIRGRGANAKGRTGDLQLDAFAARLSEFEGALSQIEAIMALALQKPAREWTDVDRDRALIEIADLASQFLRVERLLDPHCASPSNFALGFDTISEDAVANLADQLLGHLEKAGLDQRSMLAALTRVTDTVIAAPNERVSNNDPDQIVSGEAFSDDKDFAEQTSVRQA